VSSIQEICSYIFWPLAVVMGVEIEDAGEVAKLLGTKIFADEYISFKELGIIRANGGMQVDVIVKKLKDD